MKYTHWIVITLSLFIILSCGNNNDQEKDEDAVFPFDSQVAVCDSLELTGDSIKLENEAARLLSISQSQNTKIRVALYKASSLYNQRRFDTALKQLEDIYILPGWSTFTEGQVRGMFLESRCYQKKGNYTTAIRMYECLIALQPSEGNTNETKIVANFMNEGLLQLMYCYIFSGKREDGADYFTRLYNENRLWLTRNYPRNLEVCLAYSLYEASHLEDAVKVIDMALARPEAGRSMNQLFVDYSIAGVIYNQAGDVHKAIECSEKGISIARTLTDKNGIFFALSNLAYQYQQVGEFDKSLELYEELLSQNEVKNDPYSLCVTEVNVVQLYDEWGLEEEVRKHLNRANIAAETSKKPDALLRVINLKAGLALEAGLTDSTVVLLNQIKALLPDEKQNNYYRIFYDHFSCISALQNDSVRNSITTDNACELLYKLENSPMDNLNILTCRLLGATFAKKGEIDLAIDAYSLCCDYIQKNNLLNNQRKVYSALGELYYKNNTLDKSLQYFQLYDKANKAFTKRRATRQMAEFKVKYQTREQEQANQILEAEVGLKERTIQFYTLIGIVICLFAAILIGWFILRNRSLRLQHNMDRKLHELDCLQKEENLRRIREQEEQLHRILTDRQELNRKNEELRAEIERSGTENMLQGVMQNLSPRLLTNEEEQDFRRQFITVYPSFLFSLREQCPAITRAEELLAMLIRLNLNNEEISLALGINRTSVNTSRSRLRKKLKLEDGNNLEELIKNI